MKKIVCTLVFAAVMFAAEAQDFRCEYYDSLRAMQESVDMKKGAVVMLGNSITERGRWSEYFPGTLIYNRGIGGDIIAGMQDRLKPIVASRPAKVFIMAGVNDLLFFAMSVEEYRTQMHQLITTIRRESPRTKLYVQSLLPVNADSAAEGSRKYFEGKNPGIEAMNKALKKLAAELDVTYIDIYPRMLNSGALDPEYTIDGIHLSPAGYLVWAKLLKPYIR